MNKFLTDRYDDIIKMSFRICKGSKEHEDVAHHAIESFLTHKRGQEIVDKGQGMLFMSGIIHRSFHSSTSPYHTLYRQKGRMHTLYQSTLFTERFIDEPYDDEADVKFETVMGIIEEMQADTVEQWFRSQLFLMWTKEPNFSKLSRETKIPRTSISQAVNECIDYIKTRVNEYGIDT